MALNQRAYRQNSISWIAGALRVLLVAGAATLSTVAVAQQAPADNMPNTVPSSTNADTSASAIAFGASSDSTDNAPSTSTVSSLNGPGTPMPADQIVQILQENPELLQEVKSQVADRMQQQGMQLQSTDISDEMLYSQIATNPAVRTGASTFLQAQGYAGHGGAPPIDAAGPAGFPSAEPSSSVATPGLAGGEQDTAEGLFPRSTTTPPVTHAVKPPDRGHEESNASTDAPRVLRQPAPYDLPSMRDLYTQIPERTAPLKRFGSEMFLNRGVSGLTRDASTSNTPLAVPLGPDYVVSPGDSLTINLWGGLTQTFSRVIDPDGHIFLPEAGSVQVAGLTLQNAQNVIEAALKKQYRDVHVSVTMSRLRSVRVYIVGDVQRPGGYDISSLATPLSALYAAGGPTSVGSLRIVRHYRGAQLIETVDLYDFLLHGVQNGSARFESGDTVQIPPAGAQVAVSGAIKRPAIYELKPGESKLSAVLADAGGVTAAASLSHITIERIEANRERVTVTLQAGNEQDPGPDDGLNTFSVRDGDRIHIAPILPYSERAVYLEGHVVRPGRLPYTESMRLSDILRSYQDMLPEPAARGEIVRLVPPDLHAETIAFDVPDVLIGNADLPLQPFDTIRIFGRYELDMPTVTIHGEVLRPGNYPLSKGMTAGQLVRMAGGFKRDALLDSADLTSYQLQDGHHVDGRLTTLSIGAAVAGTDAHADVLLKPGDVLTIHQITGWNEIGQSVTIQGQVRFPGSFGFQEGERLSSVLRRAGGMRDTAYPEGAVLVRAQVRELEEKSREELIRQIETNSSAARLGPAVGAGDSGGTLQLIKAQQEQAVAQLKGHPATGRMVIQISADIDSWANTPADIELRRGDVLTIPKRPGFVLVTGQVYNATALTFAPGKTAAWYLSRAGGTNSTANRKEIFIIRANGSVIGRHSGGWMDPNVLSTRLDAGDVVVVPQKIIGSSLVWRNLLTTAQLASSIGLTAGIAAAAL